jgi:aspartyl/asparaginyl-tRNA synthetase
VLAVAAKTQSDLSIETVPSPDDLTKITPLASNGLALTIASPSTSFGGTSTNLMKILASLNPLSSLKGTTEYDEAQVESWLTYGITNIEVPVSALKVSSKSSEVVTSIKKDLAFALSVINCHLMPTQYMVGNDVTIADIALLSALKEAADAGLWDPTSTDEKLVNITKWYKGLFDMEFFQDALTKLSAGSESSSSPSSIPAATGGVTLHGVAPPVVNKLYKRNRIRIKEVLANAGNYYGKTVTVAGWVRTSRTAGGKLLFLELNDGSCGTSLQCVCEASETKGFEESKKSGKNTGSSFQLVGVLHESKGEGQAAELKVTEAKLLGAVYGGDAEGKTVGGMLYPMSKKGHTLEHMRQHAHLRPRAALHAAAMRVRHAMAFATHKFFHDHGFLYIHTPIITCADCEGAGEQFGITTLLGADHHKTGVELPFIPEPEKKELSKKELKRIAKMKAQGKVIKEEKDDRVVGAVDYSQDFFGKRANLTVSGQLNVETHACALSDVYTFGPTFRAENSHTTRHLCEFWMIEPEIAFADLEDDINLAEDYLKYCVEYALEMCKEDLEFFENSPFGEAGLRDRLKNVLDNPFKVSKFCR